MTPRADLRVDDKLFCGRPSRHGAIAQLVERVLCKHEVVGSIPSGSTTLLRPSGFAGTGPSLRATQEALRSLGEGGLQTLDFNNNPLRAIIGKHEFPSRPGRRRHV